MTQTGPSRQQVGDLLAGLTSDPPRSAREWRERMLALVRALAAGARVSAAEGGKWLTDVMVDTAPRLPIRSADVLRSHHPGFTDDEVADRLVAAAIKATTAVGAAGGGLAAVQFTAPPTLLAAPVQLAAETLAVAAIEIKLVAELHELYGMPAAGTGSQRAMAYLTAWADRRGVDPMNPRTLGTGLSAAARRQIQRRLVGRAGRNAFTLGPFLTGAAAGAVLNRRETRKLADQVLTELRLVS